MFHSLGSLKSLWHSVKDQIAQKVPRSIEFCEFECTLKRCTLETNGRRDIRPRTGVVLIMPARAAMRPGWEGNRSGPAAPALVN